MSEAEGRERIVLGLDPGTRFLGYGAVVRGARAAKLYAAGRIITSPGMAVAERLLLLRRELDGLLSELRPDVVVVEEAFCGKNAQSALRMGEGRGVALSCAAACGARVVQIPPASAKKSVCGNGRASKVQVAAMVARILGERARGLPEDASDALALALAYVQESPVRATLLRESRGGVAARRFPTNAAHVGPR